MESKFQNKTLLIIGAGREQVPGIKIAKELGLHVVATDSDQNAPGFKYADDCGIVSTYDAEGNAHFAFSYNKKRPIEGVIAVGSDVPITVAMVAEKLGLHGHSLQTARLASNKLEMKTIFKKNGVPVPLFQEVKTIADIKTFIKKHGYPVVVKPVDARGARGVLRIVPGIDISSAFLIAKKESLSGRVMVETFLHGPQISTESIIYDGRIFTPGLSDRNYEYLEKYSPYIIENGGELPANIDRKQKKTINGLLKKAAHSLGITHGSIKGDIVYTSDGPKIIEIAARLSGGYFATTTIPLSTGVNIVEEVIRISLGYKPNFNALRTRHRFFVAQRFFFPPCPGVIQKITGFANIKKMEGVYAFDMYVKPGDTVSHVDKHTSRLGYVITASKKREDAIETARKVISSVRIHIA